MSELALTMKHKRQWYLLRYAGGGWTPFRLPDPDFIEAYGHKFECRGPYEDMVEALAAVQQ